ncbi:hypothetical protein LCGC14_2500810 [marine sediment metagenome]|uniref:Uncharacterized protein n=1 Tax=marine sediment metagenome TaxID=412755 RepID=A0A0F9BPX7_9ZZZZ
MTTRQHTAQERARAMIGQLTQKEREKMFWALTPSPWQRGIYKTIKFLFGKEAVIKLVQKQRLLWPRRRA